MRLGGKYGFYFGLLLISATAQAAAPPQESFEKAIAVLEHLPSGRHLLSQAKGFWGFHQDQDLLKHLRGGSASRTDAILIRKFDPGSGVETRERQVVVYLRTPQPLRDLVLDLSHELVHATTRPIWDPYDPSLTAAKYVWASIEGQGGEVDAVYSECRVEADLAETFGVKSDRCSAYSMHGDESQLRKQITMDFYRVGKWNSEVEKELGAEKSFFPNLSAETPRLYSSTGHAPYPVALYREYQELTRAACDNSRKRQQSRALASTSDSSSSLSQFLVRRCDTALR